jgi:hypothetical protein
MLVAPSRMRLESIQLEVRVPVQVQILRELEVNLKTVLVAAPLPLFLSNLRG